MTLFEPPEFIHDFSSCERCYATLCIYHQDVSPNDITNTLSVQPSREQRVGGKLRKNRVVNLNGWFLTSEGDVDSKDVRAHIWHLIKKIENKGDALKNMIERGHEIRMTCLWESASGNGGPIIDIKTMAALSALQIELDFDIWFSG
jgi:hypothetical protein